jgi:hypothetical protein
MRKIKIEKWKAKLPDGTEIEESILSALSALISNKKPEEIPRGLDKYRLYNRLAKAFDKAEETGILELEEAEYSFLKETVEKDIPSIWGSNKDISEAIDLFLEAKQE